MYWYFVRNKERLLKLNNNRIIKDRNIVIKAQEYRKPTKPTASLQQKQVHSKRKRSQVKFNRKKVDDK